MENENVNIDGAKEANKRSFEVLDELFAYPEEKQGDLDFAKNIMNRFLIRVHAEMEHEGIDIHDLANAVNEDAGHLSDALNGEVFIEWVLFSKLTHYLNIDITFNRSTSDQ